MSAILLLCLLSFLQVERVLLSAFSGESEGLFSSMWLFNQGDGPLGCLGLPEEQIQQRLMKMAFETVRLPVAQEFQLSFPSSKPDTTCRAM